MLLLLGAVLVSHLPFVRVNALRAPQLYAAAARDAAGVPLAVAPVSVVAWAHAGLMLARLLHVQARVRRYRPWRMRRVQQDLDATRGDRLNARTAVVRAFGHGSRLPPETYQFLIQSNRQLVGKTTCQLHSLSQIHIHTSACILQLSFLHTNTLNDLLLSRYFSCYHLYSSDFLLNNIIGYQ